MVGVGLWQQEINTRKRQQEQQEQKYCETSFQNNFFFTFNRKT